MADIVSKVTRSRMMSGISGKNTKPEVTVRKFLHGRGLRFRLHDGNLPGRPDIVLARWNAVVVVNGCYWHQHQGCRFAYIPATNTAFWRAKLGANVVRDRRNAAKMRTWGWRVFTVWECEAQNLRKLDRLERRIRNGIK